MPTATPDIDAEPDIEADILGEVAPDGGAKTQAKAQARDRAPKKGARGRGRPPGSTGAATKAKEDAKILAALSQLLYLPAVPMGMVGHVWPAEHIERNSGPYAQTLVDASHSQPKLRAFLVDLSAGGAFAQLTMGTIAYFAPIAIYFATNNGHPARRVMGVGDRPVRGPAPMGGMPVDAAGRPMGAPAETPRPAAPAGGTTVPPRPTAGPANGRGPIGDSQRA